MKYWWKMAEDYRQQDHTAQRQLGGTVCMELVLNTCRRDRDEVEEMQECVVGKNYEEGFGQ